MIFTDAEAIDLKVWVVKKLEDISDADSDVLADYVLALIRADSSEPELRKSAVENLEDFLKDNTSRFVDELFHALHAKSYVPGYVAPPVAPVSSQSTSPVALNPSVHAFIPQPDRVGNINGSPNQSRKRTFDQRGDEDGSRSAIAGRECKQMRRGRGRGGRETEYGGRGGRGGFQTHNTNGISSGMLSAPGFPAPPPIDPTNFNPNDFGAALAAMQSLMPMLGQVNPTSGQPQNGQRPRGKCHSFFNKGFCNKGNACPYDHGTDRIIVPDQEYDPKNAVMSEVQMSPTSPIHSDTIMGGTLSNGPVRGGGRGRGRGDRNANPPRKNRAEFSSSGPNFDRSNTTIVVEQIPEEKFNEQSVRAFFSEFGNIEEVTMMAYKRLALVKYDNYFSAKSAYESPKVIFDNRFVKVYWYKPDTAPKASPDGQASGVSPKEGESFDPERFARDQEAAQRKLEEKKAALKEQEDKRQALEKQREELASRQAEEKKRLMEKLAAKGQNMDIDEKEAKTTTNGAETKKDDKASEKTKALRAQLASLEAEAESLGLDTALSDTTTWPPRGGGRGRGRGGAYRGYDPSFRGGGYRGRGAIRGRGGAGGGGGAYNLDNRPKKVAVSGVTWDGGKDEALRQHLLTIGDYVSIEQAPDNQANTQIVSFNDRATAEKFMYSASKLAAVIDKIELAWVKPAPLPPVKATQAGPDGDTMMRGGDADGGAVNGINGGGGVGQKEGERTEVEYDVAEEDFDVAE